MAFEIRPVTDEEFPTFAARLERTFGGAPTEQQLALWRKGTELDRTVAAFDGGDIVGTASSWAMEMTLPGLVSVPVAGVTDVGVASTHRRQGILTGMMGRLLDDVAARGEPLAILLASESVIYGRFGYGWATSRASVDVDPSRAAIVRPSTAGGRMRQIDNDAALKLLPPVHEAIRLAQPGDVSRPFDWWEYVVADVDPQTQGKPPRFWAVHENGAGEPDGFVAYRFAHSWEHGLPNNRLEVTDLMGTDVEVEMALWAYLLSIDLIATVQVDYRPLDDPIRRRLADPRRVRTLAVADHIWVRLLDLPGALSARSYATDDTVVFEVHDPFRPANDGRYEVSGAGAKRTRAKVDLALGVDDLGAAFLGGVTFSHLARARRVEERKPGALRRADMLFSCDPPPFCRTGF
jgi:predicted acetyltransferase